MLDPKDVGHPLQVSPSEDRAGRLLQVRPSPNSLVLSGNPRRVVLRRLAARRDIDFMRANPMRCVFIFLFISLFDRDNAVKHSYRAKFAADVMQNEYIASANFPGWAFLQ